MSSHIWTGRATRPLAVGLGLGLAASALTLTTSSTASAVVEPVDVTIVATNDCHGRLLPARDAGMLAVRHRLVDVVLLGGVGGLLLFLARTIPNQPGL